ncbi:MAG: FMN-binding protein [Candidatus Sumerlaeia bacterium]
MRNIALIMLVLLTLTACAGMRGEIASIKHVDLSTIPDGKYVGEHKYHGSPYKVETTVMDHKIVAVEILDKPKGKYAKKASAITEKVVAKQSPRVDAVSGATKSSVAFLKAVEASLLNPSSKKPCGCD